MSEATHALTPFGWPVVIYLTLAGMAAGSALVSAWTLLRGEAIYRRPAIRGLGLAAASIAVGGLALVADLEAPERFWLILAYFNPGSMIAWGARIITLFWILATFAWAVLRREPEAGRVSPGMRSVLGLVAILAVAVGLYPGWVLLQAAARPLWGSPWIAPLFLASAIHAGLAASWLLSPSGGGEGRKPFFGPRSERLLVIAQAALLVLWFLTATRGYEVAAQRMVSGELAVWLWGGVVLLGWLVPLGLAGRGPLLTRVAAVLLGVFALRALILFGGQGSAALLSTMASAQP